MMKTLYIDTRNNKEIIVRIEIDGKTFEKKSAAVENHAQTILPLVAGLLKKARLKVADLDEIRVETGPGSFTGLKVGAAIANALSFAGMVKVNGKELGEVIEPDY